MKLRRRCFSIPPYLLNLEADLIFYDTTTASFHVDAEDNPQKGRLETITAHLGEDSTTCFGGTWSPECVSMITDLDGDLLITCDGRSYSVINYDVSRKSINYSRKKAGKLLKQALV